MNPTAGDMHVNRPLTNISIAHFQGDDGFVADQVFPNIPVQRRSDIYVQYDRSDFARDEFRERAPSTESAGGGYKVDKTPTYYCKRWALHKDIDDEFRPDVDDPFNLDRDATIYLSQQAKISREVNWASKYFATGVWSQDLTGVAAAPAGNQFLHWSDDTSNPITYIKARSDAIHLKALRRPNTLVMGRQVWTVLSEHPDCVDRIKFSSTNTTPAIVMRAAVAALFELDRILVMDGIQVTSKENPDFETSMVTAFIGAKNGLLVYAAPQASIMMPSGGYTFSWNGYLGASEQGVRIKKFRMDLITSDRVEAEMAYDQKMVSRDCGEFLTGMVA
jgi:hypothetical protein